MYQRFDTQSGDHIGAPGPLPYELDGLAAHVLLNPSAFLHPDAVAVLGLAGVGFEWVPDPLPELPPILRKLSKADFWRRFTAAEQVVVLGARKHIAEMSAADFANIANMGWWRLAVVFQMLDLVSEVELDHPETVEGLEAIAAAGIIAADRVLVILQ